MTVRVLHQDTGPNIPPLFKSGQQKWPFDFQGQVRKVRPFLLVNQKTHTQSPKSPCRGHHAAREPGHGGAISRCCAQRSQSPATLSRDQTLEWLSLQMIPVTSPSSLLGWGSRYHGAEGKYPCCALFWISKSTELESTKLFSFHHEAWDGLMHSNSMFFHVWKFSGRRYTKAINLGLIVSEEWDGDLVQWKDLGFTLCFFLYHCKFSFIMCMYYCTFQVCIKKNIC